MKLGAMPSKMRGRLAFTLMEVLVLVAIGMILAVLFLPGHVGSHKVAVRINCVNNLKQVGAAFRVWSTDSREWFPTHASTNDGGTREFLSSTNVSIHFRALSNELNTPKVLSCPADNRDYATNFDSDLNNSKISYFLGLDAELAHPQMLLSGDRNLASKIPMQNSLLNLSSNDPVNWTMEMHQGNGSVVHADGSVQYLTQGHLREALANTRTNVNRLLFP